MQTGTNLLFGKAQYKGLEVNLIHLNSGMRSDYNKSGVNFIPTIKIDIFVRGIFKFSPETRAKLEYVEDLKPDTRIGNFYTNAFEYAKSIIDGEYAG